MLQWTLGHTCLFQFWFPQDVCPAVGLLGCMAVLVQVFKESPHCSPFLFMENSSPLRETVVTGSADSLPPEEGKGRELGWLSFLSQLCYSFLTFVYFPQRECFWPIKNVYTVLFKEHEQWVAAIAVLWFLHPGCLVSNWRLKKTIKCKSFSKHLSFISFNGHLLCTNFSRHYSRHFRDMNKINPDLCPCES